MMCAVRVSVRIGVNFKVFRWFADLRMEVGGEGRWRCYELYRFFFFSFTLPPVSLSCQVFFCVVISLSLFFALQTNNMPFLLYVCVPTK